MDDALAEANQAQAMIRRVSPQGRAEARRLREIRARRTRRLAIRCGAVAMTVIAGYYLLSAAIGPFGPTGFPIAIAFLLLGCALVAILGREKRTAEPAVGPGDLPLLPDRTEAWMATQRPALPAPAVTLLDAIGLRIAGLRPQLASLDETGAPAEELRKLVGTELPGLVDQYRAIPAGLRGEARDDGATPDARLLHGLAVVDRQLTDLTRRIGAGAADGLSTHDRYLEGKYGDTPAGDSLS